MKTVIDSLTQLTIQNINICQVVERALSPIIINSVLNLLDEALDVGLDHDVDLTQGKGIKKLKVKVGQTQSD